MGGRVTVVYRDGMSLEATDAGPLDAPVLLLLHGFPQDASCWSDVSTVLTAAGLRTLALTQRGYSPGARPRATSGYRFRELVDDALAAADAAGARTFHVVGHDWGALVAWALAASTPHRVTSLTALSVPHPAAMRASLVHGQALRSWYMGLFQLRGAAERLLRPGSWSWRQLVRGLPDAAATRYAERMSAPGALAGALSWYQVLPSELLRPSVAVGRIEVPTLFLWGTRDPALGRWAAEHTQEHVGAAYRFVPLEGAGHWLPETRGDVVGDAVQQHVQEGQEGR